ncbi:CAP domain-containing protein [uncultured Ilumatobacter sp.]|uniref:CAP domain-containing protein n=1 Tax=uncultured Ilumatobacter sp. TaxID=879968 RepID=UPI00374E9436
MASGTLAEAQAVLDLTNAERTSRDLSPVSLHLKFTQAAKSHFTDQFSRGCSNFSHTGSEWSSPFDRIRSTDFSYRAAGENLACGFQAPGAVLDGWMNSASHSANMRYGKFASIGIVAAPDAFSRLCWV